MKKNNLTSAQTLGPIKELILLGGGKLLLDLALWAKSEKLRVKVITSLRHEKEYINKKKLSICLKNQNIDYIITKDINSNLVKNFLKNVKDPFYLSCSGAWIFNSLTISSLFKNKLFNYHSTGLPQNRGGGGYSWQIMMGIKFGYCTLHLVNDKIDEGPIIENEEFIFPASARKPVEFQKIAEKKNFEFIKNFLLKYKYKKKILKSNLQQDHLSTYWPRLNSNLNAWINWSMNSEELERFICAFDDPYGGAKTLVNGKIVKIKDVQLSTQDGPFHSYQNGIVFRKGKNWLCVSIKNFTLIIKEILDEKNMDIFEKIKVGDRFTTPFSKLELSLERIIYTPVGLKKKKN